ncbi:MAG: DUF2799 domain-containing protein [Alcaligenaceae bacterium]|nr:DUF2799 domain-containing protein [Alcaligenaceae bacterium]
MFLKFKKQGYRLLAIGATLALTACAIPSLSPEQCTKGDWRSIGYNDGVNGRYASRLNEHQEACAESGVIPNYKLWEAGRQEGLVHYCTSENAKRLGLAGRQMNAVCPSRVSNYLQRINNKALEHRQRQVQLRQDRQRLTKYTEQLKQLRNGEMLDFESEVEARNYMLELQNKIYELKRRIRQAEQDDFLDY